MLLRDLVTFAKNARYLPVVLDASDTTNSVFRERFSEETLIESAAINASKVLKTAIRGNPVKRIGATFYEVGEREQENEKWFFVNGICSDRETAVLQGECLSTLFNRNITVVHNPSYGPIPDLVECAFERTFDGTCAVTADLYTEIVKALFSGKKIKLIGHSQGGIIVSRVLRVLKEMELGAYKNLEVYTFASGADEDVPLEGVHQEHFVNTDDFVSRIGLLDVRPKETLYVRRSKGHLLNRDYLEHFAGGHFCGKSSRLYKLMGANRG